MNIFIPIMRDWITNALDEEFEYFSEFHKFWENIIVKY